VLLTLCFVPSVVLAGQPCGTAAPLVPEGRPRIGLALGGGSARGLAHVGVLEWLEEHRIPVDVIAGTSIGGLIGGGYATGRSAAEVRTLIEGIDWDAMFRGEVDYALKTFRRKEDRRDFPVRLDLGLRDGLRLAPGLDPGHEVELFLSRLAVSYTAPMCFDDLPIPFRAVATDLEAASVEELDEGSLGTALRATMAIPGIFQPIERDDRLLTDGGLLNNVPADVTRSMGADVVIAVDVSAPLESREALSSLVAVANQAIGVMMVQRTRAVLETHADYVVTPALEDIGADGWREFETIRARGYAAADAVAGSLAAFSLAPTDWARHLEARRRRRSTASAELTFVRVDGVDADIAADIVRRLEPEIGSPLDPVVLERRLTMPVPGVTAVSGMTWSERRSGPVWRCTCVRSRMAHRFSISRSSSTIAQTASSSSSVHGSPRMTLACEMPRRVSISRSAPTSHSRRSICGQSLAHPGSLRPGSGSVTARSRCRSTATWSRPTEPSGHRPAGTSL